MDATIFHCEDSPESRQLATTVLEWLDGGMPPEDVMTKVAVLCVGTGLALGVPEETLHTVIARLYHQFSSESPSRIVAVPKPERN